jgi:hypothetical protein
MSQTIHANALELLVAHEEFTRLPGTNVTICAMTVKNGFVIIGKSACVHAEDYDQAIANKVAHEDAIGQLWQFEGYIAKEREHNRELNAALIERAAEAARAVLLQGATPGTVADITQSRRPQEARVVSEVVTDGAVASDPEKPAALGIAPGGFDANLFGVMK